MQIVEFTADTLRFADAVPAALPAEGFVWLILDREELPALLPNGIEHHAESGINIPYAVFDVVDVPGALPQRKTHITSRYALGLPQL